MTLKLKVLQALEDNIGRTISGEDLAMNLSVTRNSIWKAVSSLRHEGYEINALTNKGYCLLENNDVISEIGLKKYLNTNYSGDIYTYKTIDSTNRAAKKFALEGAKNSTLVISEEQTNGKGRLGRSFYSPSNNGIYMSMILKPKLSIFDSVLITTATSVAICRAIKKVTNIDTTIKWVNDIILHEKKVCGILTEAVTDFESGNIEYIIIGIGINFTEPAQGYPDDIKSLATSLYSNNTSKVTRNELAAEIINEILDILPEIKERKFIKEYRNRSIILGKEIIYYINGNEYRGLVIDINENGALVVESEGNTKIINSGEITIRKI